MADEARELFPVTFGWDKKPNLRKPMEHLKAIPEPTVEELAAVEVTVEVVESEMGKATGTGTPAKK